MPLQHSRNRDTLCHHTKLSTYSVFLLNSDFGIELTPVTFRGLAELLPEVSWALRRSFWTFSRNTQSGAPCEKLGIRTRQGPIIESFRGIECAATCSSDIMEHIYKCEVIQTGRYHLGKRILDYSFDVAPYSGSSCHQSGGCKSWTNPRCKEIGIRKKKPEN